MNTSTWRTEPGTGRRTGVWFVGARGSVATTATLGALAVAGGLDPGHGMVTGLPGFAGFAGIGLPGPDELVIGGHDVVAVPLAKRAEALADAGVVPLALVRALGAELNVVDARLRQPDPFPGAPQQLAVEQIVADLREFAVREGCDRVVVVNVASTEAPYETDERHGDLAVLRAALARGPGVLPTSSLYAYAAFDAGCSFVDFTPGAGVRAIPALVQLAEKRGLPWAGSDGKTGETLVRSALTAMFGSRALRVRSWAGVNLLGGGDGASLADPAARSSKTASKRRGLAAGLGYDVDAPLHIDYVPDMGEWKTAWDHVSFDGFLGTAMSLQFTWQGCDSALAAPLVLDLARLVARAQETGGAGPLGELGFFFKDPAGSDEHRLAAQFETLLSWARTLDGPTR